MGGLLENKVVVISGVGPALGTTLARRCAEAGADLVLAARTVERLDDVAKQVTDLGRRAVAIGTDITDDSAGGQPRQADAGGLRQGRRADQQRLPGAVDEAVRQHHVRAHPGGHRADRARCAADDPGLHAGAGRGQRLGGERELDGDPAFRSPSTAPTRWPRRRCWRCRSRWPPSSATQGIRVNSVAPGYIWGGTLQGYFEHQAGKYGTTVDEIYKAAAVNSDLKRLPTEDEVASAILFMASDLSSGITGQTLDVNCGEYKA